MRRNRPSCNGVPNKQMLRTRHHVFEHRNLAAALTSRVIETLPRLAPALFGLLEGALRRTHGGYLLTVPIGAFDEDAAVSRENTSNGIAELHASAVCPVS